MTIYLYKKKIRRKSYLKKKQILNQTNILIENIKEECYRIIFIKMNLQ